MASNKPLPILITALCLILPASLWAQTTEPPFVQRLTWVGDEYATRYEVIIEKEENGKYKRVLQKFTTAFFIEISLPHGNYRYQVIPYDFFNLPVPVKEWMNFEVKSQEIIMATPDKPESKNEVIIQSPEPETRIEYKNPFVIYMGLEWIPVLPIYGRNKSFGRSPSPYSAGLRLSIFSAKQNILKLGTEGSFSWCLSPDNQPMQSLTFDLNIVARLSDDNAALNSKMGIGVSLRSDASHVSASGQYAVLANFGLSSIFWLPKHLYLEFSMEYIQFFTNSGFLRPSFGLGYRF
jgi:hypothetical protein